MKSCIYGKSITRTYRVKLERDTEGKIKRKPQLEVEKEETTFCPIIRKDGEELVVDGKIGHNLSYYSPFSFSNKINIDETTEVCIEKEIYRADLNAYIVYTNHILYEDDTNKEEAKSSLEKLVSEYNREKIEADEKALTYCNLHKLNPAETDYDELVSIIYPENYKEVKVAAMDFTNGLFGVWGLNPGE